MATETSSLLTASSSEESANHRFLSSHACDRRIKIQTGEGTGLGLSPALPGRERRPTRRAGLIPVASPYLDLHHTVMPQAPRASTPTEVLAGLRRARHVPQRRERLLRAARQSPRSARPDHRPRSRGDDCGRRVRPSQRELDQRPLPRRPVQSLVPQSDAAADGRGDREISRLRDGPQQRVGLRESLCTFYETVFDIIVEEPIAIKSRP